MTSNNAFQTTPLQCPESWLPERYRFEAMDSHSGALIALDSKTQKRVKIQYAPVSWLDDDARFQFSSNLQLLADVKSANFLCPLHWDLTDEIAYAVHGIDHLDPLSCVLQQQIENTGSPLPAMKALEYMRQALETISQIHERACTQRDFRLAQFYISGQRILLSCPGPMPYADPNCRPEQWMIRFAEFASPELSGLIEQDVGAASDIYSLGILFFYMISGRAPFTGAKLGDILFKHLTELPDMNLLGNVSRPIVQVISRMLSKEPRDRYQSATAVIRDLDQIIQIENRGLEPSHFVVGRCDERNSITDPAFVGRRSELNLIKEAIDQVKMGLEQSVAVRCPSGIGKTRFVIESLRFATNQEFGVYRSMVKDQAGQKPTAPLLDIINQLKPQKHLHARMREELVEYETDIRQILPDFAKTIGWSPSPTRKPMQTAPEEFGTNRVNQAICQIMASIASPQTPVLIWIDDCQWLSPQAVDILAEFQKIRSPHTLLIMSMRDNAEFSKHFLSKTQPTHLIELTPLSEMELHALIESMAGQLPTTAVTTAVNLSMGSPFMASAIVRGMVETGALGFQNGSWTVSEARMSTIQASTDAAQALLKRLERVPTSVLEQLSFAAIIGKEFESSTVTEIAKLSNAQAFENFNWAREKRLIWAKPDGKLTFSHDKIREALIARLGPSQKKQRHAKIAAFLAAHAQADPSDVAFHFDAADDPTQALPFALTAASSARESCSLGAAVQLLRIALRGIPDHDQELKHQIEADLAESLMIDGRYDESDHWFEHAARSASSVTSLARIELKRGELALRRGDKVEAVRLFESCLSQLGSSLPSSVGLYTRLVKEACVQVLHSCLPQIFVGRKKQEPSESDRLIWRSFSRLAHGYWYTKSKLHVLWAHLRGMNLAETFAPTRELAQAYSEHAPAASLIPWYSRGSQYSKRSLKIRADLGDVWGEGQSRGFFSILLHATSRFDQCVDQARQAEEILLRTGDYWEVNIARYQNAAALYRLGKLQESLDAAKKTYNHALEIGDYQSTGNIIDVWARAAQGNIPFQIVEAEKQRSIDDQQAQCQVLLAEGIQLIHREKFDSAVRRFTKATKVAEKDQVVNAYTTPNYAWLATALRMEFETNRTPSSEMRAKAANQILKAARRAVRVSRRFKNDLPHALRELGRAYAIHGCERRAKIAFQKSLALADQQNAAYETALTLEAFGQVGTTYGWADSQAYLTSARKQILKLTGGSQVTQRVDSISLVDRFDALLDAGRSISSSTNEAKIFERTTKSSKLSIRGTQTAIIRCTNEPDGHQNWKCVETAFQFDSDLVRHAASQKRTLVRNNETDKSVSEMEAGSKLCSPIVVQGETIACLYVSNNLIRGIYGQDEIRIADFLTSTAGAALEKAAGFQQLEELNRCLEQKVLERTETIEARSKQLETTAFELRVTQSKLELARDQAEAANHTKSGFLARMSHEIRTPISAVIGFTDLLLRGVVRDPDEQIQKLETIRNSGKHLLQLVNDLLDLTKIEADMIDVESIHFSPTRILRDVVDTLQPRALENNNSLELRFEGPLPRTMIGDPKRFQQVLTNVLGNAIKFTSGGSVVAVMRLQASRVIAGTLCLETEITDTGIGMSESQIAKIFDPFVQADSSVTRRFGGTGLGLAISKQLAESLGGGIAVSSQENQGSSFVVSIDAGEPDSLELITEEKIWHLLKNKIDREWVRVDLNDVKILIADDAETNRELLSCVLQECNAQVDIVEDGAQAVQAVESGEVYDIVLMDMQMPVLDGYSATKQLREIGFEQPVIALTANTMKGDREKCISFGCSDYLSKPIAMGTLIQKLADIVGVETSVCQAPAPVIELGGSGDITCDFDLPTEEPVRSFAISFIHKLENKLPEFESTIESKDGNSLGELAHWAKGTSGTVMLNDVSEVCREMEDALRAGDWATVQGRYDFLFEYVEKMNQSPALIKS